MIPTQEEDFADILIKPVPGDLFRQYLYAALLLIQEMSKFVDPRMSSIASTTAQILIYIWTANAILVFFNIVKDLSSFFYF